MCTLQNPSPSPNPSPSSYPNRSPVSNPSPNANSATGLKPPSFEELSKLFSLPLSDAADSLGVCPSVLKKVCYDNGLVRWPYRKYLAGKSIEEIKKDATIEKEKQLAESKDSGQGASLASSAVPTSLAPQLQSINTVSLQQTPTPRMLTQQPTRDYQTETFHMHILTVNKGSSTTSDEFKYGFPSDGLSSASFRWWGKESAENGTDGKKSNIEDSEEKKQRPEDRTNAITNPSPMGVTQGKKDQADAELSSVEETEGKKDTTDAALSSVVGTEGKKDKTDADLSSVEVTEDVDCHSASSLSALRKRMAREGKQALRLGVYRGCNLKTLDPAKRLMLLQIFRSSLPGEWADVPSKS